MKMYHGKEIPEDQKGVPPRPHPILSNVRINYIEQLCSKLPPREQLDMATLKAYMKSYAEQVSLTPEERAYFVYYWVAHNIDYDVQSFFSGIEKDSSDENVLKTGKSVCAGYSKIFQSLSAELGIECIEIPCFGKGYGYEVGSPVTDKGNHAHNAIKLGGKWYLVDSTWGAGSIIDNSYHRDFNNFNFCTDPNEFILTHFPKDPSWQLLPQPVDANTFIYYPFLDKNFYEVGFVNMKPFTAICSTEQAIDIDFYFDPNRNRNIKMTCNLLLKKKPVENCVLISRYEDHFTIRILLNKKGEYLAQFFGINGLGETEFKRLTEMKIISTAEQKKPLYFPKMVKNYGKLCLVSPQFNPLPKKTNVPFKLYSKDLNEIVIVCGKQWKTPQKVNDYFEDNIVTDDKTVTICVKLGDKTFPKYIFDVK